MISTRGRGRLPTTAPPRIPPPHANSMATATSYSVTISAWPYSPASLQPACSVDDKDGRNSSGMAPMRGRTSHNTMRAMTMSRRRVVDDIAIPLRRLANMAPDAVAQASERVAAQHFKSARARQRDVQPVHDAAGTRRHHHHLVREIDGFGQAMGHEDDGLAGRSPDPQQFIAHGHAGLFVERGERLVHQQYRRILHQAARDRDPLLHAAGQFMRMTFAEAVETHELQGFFRLDAALFSGNAAQRQRKFDVLFGGQPRKQARLLEHHADPVWVGNVDRCAVDQNRPRGLRPQPGHHHQQRRLSAAAWADQHDKTAGLDLDRYVGQRHHVLPGGPVNLADAGDLNGACARRLERGYVRQWLHRVSTHLTISLKAMAIAPIIRTPASNCFIWKFSPQVAIW